MVGKDLLKILKESKYTTVLSGFEMLQEMDIRLSAMEKNPMTLNKSMATQ